ncbi:uncharacterized protein LOC142331532 [Lycorma delicatula]|uniref:uncharacterized protein LOC142331532 n=1 Tax=Lycorma delicatula TaxID=130591 RepID=UPI003F518605
MSDDDDDEGNQPTKYEFSEESKLDEDHVFFLQFTNNFISNVTRPRDFDHCTRWLERLAGEPMFGVEAKRNRNMFLAKLLVAMMDNQVKGPFLSFPPSGPLPNAARAFGLISEEERMEEVDMAFDWPDREMLVSDYKCTLKDGRTYVAVKRLPDASGVMGYIGISTGGGEGLWINKEGERVSLTDVLCSDTIPAVTAKTPLEEQVKMVESYHWTKADVDDGEGGVPFDYIHKLPESRSDSNLVEVKSLNISPLNCRILSEMYPVDLVKMLAELVAKAKTGTEKRLRARHTKVVEQLYKGYQAEVERGLHDYKLARIEWNRVMTIIQALKDIQKEVANRDSEMAGSSSDQMKMLSDTFNDAVSRKKLSYQANQELEAQKQDMHKVIHDRATIQRKELRALEGQCEKLLTEISRLRGESRHKQQVIEALVMDIKSKKMPIFSCAGSSK